MSASAKTLAKIVVVFKEFGAEIFKLLKFVHAKELSRCRTVENKFTEVLADTGADFDEHASGFIRCRDEAPDDEWVAWVFGETKNEEPELADGC